MDKDDPSSKVKQIFARSDKDGDFLEVVVPMIRRHANRVKTYKRKGVRALQGGADKDKVNVEFRQKIRKSESKLVKEVEEATGMVFAAAKPAAKKAAKPAAKKAAKTAAKKAAKPAAKKRKANAWVQATKEWNAGRGDEMYCIPKRGTEVYKEVRAIADRLKAKK